ncbi:uncharacterized protein LOC122320671 [Drosophila ficusphila]|uniref:uncharacterized protein LOC122320671 n=1 Tax=Drosophila ficusphila TaxID=30025 RepID=UPI001C898443|nr:uncharacterized protein LOC122320671 [Drosophila ficusphila]
MSKKAKNIRKTRGQDFDQSGNSSSCSNNSSSGSGDLKIRRKHKLRRRSGRNVSFCYQALPMRIVGDNSEITPDIPCSSRDITLNSAHIIEDSSDSEFHISNDTSNDEPANQSITFAARPIEKPDLEFIKKLRKPKQRKNKTLYKD